MEEQNVNQAACEVGRANAQRRHSHMHGHPLVGNSCVRCVHTIGAGRYVCVRKADDAIVGEVRLQDGALQVAGVNGFGELELLAILAHRLQQYQSGPLACGDNAVALACVQAAREALVRRANDRNARGVAGTSQP